ncbi:excisionase family DNA-binding protein [Corynebacterium auriscanis]|uniref:excisionase family DNA-binding protein n=1 Tax=Corynebacterium auriscanis TaxID=99807 RepID=UPI003CF2B5E7
MPSYTPTTHPCQPYLSLREASELGYGGNSTLRKKIATGQLPAIRVGRQYRVLQSDLEALAEPVSPGPGNILESIPDHIRDWARDVASSAPPLTASQAAAVTRIIQGGAAA